MAFLSRFKWQGFERITTLPFLRNRLEYTSDPNRVEEYSKCPFTRSKLTMDLLTRFHLSNNSIVVSDDEHAGFMRSLFFERVVRADRFPEIARNLVDAVFVADAEALQQRSIRLSSVLIREVYVSLLENMLGVDVLPPLTEYIRRVDFRPGMRPMQMEGLLFALVPDFAPLRAVVDMLFYGGERYTKRIARKLEELIFDFATPHQNSWYSMLLELKASSRITAAQFRGELTSILVSSYSLAAAMSAMLLCIAVRPEYVPRIQRDLRFARCFVNEVLRLYPPFRQFGYEQKGIWDQKERARDEATDLMVSVFALHRNENAWPDPERFDPERFLVPGAQSGHKFMPFGMGSRACSGRAYSMGMLVEVLRSVCSDECGIELRVPPDYKGDENGLPIGVSGRLISFPIDDRLTYKSNTNSFQHEF